MVFMYLFFFFMDIWAQPNLRSCTLSFLYKFLPGVHIYEWRNLTKTITEADDMMKDIDW